MTPNKPQSRSHFFTTGTVARELRLSLRNNAGAFGYSVMITCSLAILSSSDGQPSAGEVFLFLAGAVLSFALVEGVATRGFRTSLRVKDESSQVVALGSAMSLASVAAAVGAAFLVARCLPSPLSWAVGSFICSLVYLFGTSFEMTVARMIEQRRDIC